MDILLLVDNSDSMTQWLTPLGNSLPGLFALFSDLVGPFCSWHIALANGDPSPDANPAECQFAGALIQRPSACGGVEGEPAYRGSEFSDAADAFDDLQCTLLEQGFGGDEDERMLEAMLGALNPANAVSGACNAGFRRPGAHLALLYLSDENDPTPTGNQDDVATTFQSYVNPNLVSLIAVVGDIENREAACQWVPDGDEGTGAEIPVALNGFLGLSGIPVAQQARVDICETTSYDFETAFEVFDQACGL